MGRTAVEDVYPLSPLQEGMLFHTELAPRRGLYVEQLVLPLRDDRGLDVAALRRALERVVDRHPVLRSAFVWRDRKEPLQVVLRRVRVPLEELDWTELSPEGFERRLEERLAVERKRGFDLAKAPLLRLAVLHGPGGDHRLAVTYHHILMDAWSIGQVFGELRSLYEGCRDGGDVPDLPAVRPYRDYVAWLQRRDPARAEHFWRRTLHGCRVPTPLPLDRPDARPGDTYHRQRILPEGLSGEIASFARRHCLTLNTLMAAAWAILLSRHAGEEDVVFGAVVSGRPPDLDGVESMVGLFINTVPVRVSVAPEAETVPWLAGLHERLQEIRLFEHTPLSQVQRWSDARAGHPLFQSLLVVENVPGAPRTPAAAAGGGLRVGPSLYRTGSSYPLHLVVRPETVLSLEVLYDRERFAALAVERLLGQLENILARLVEDPRRRLGSLPVPGLAASPPLTPARQHQIAIEWNDTAVAYPRERTIPDLFSEVVARNPEAAAVRRGERWWSYGELDERSSRVAARLAAAGVGPEVLVGLVAERSLEVVAAILGILKAGGAYVPLDPAYPPERLSFLLEDAAIAVLVAGEGTLERLPAGAPHLHVVVLEEALSAPAPRGATPVRPLSPESLAYVLYTSGSTGRPKGVAVSHRNVARLVRGTSFASMGEAEVFFQLAPLSFDASTLELWGALLHGARLEVPAPKMPTLEALGLEIEAARVTTLWLTAGLFHEMVEAELPRLQSVPQLLAGGDVLSAPHVDRVLAGRRPGQVLINGYGPTEGTTFTCCRRMGAGTAVDGASVPIGRPISSTRVYLVTPGLDLAAMGAPAELAAAGDGVARGYLSRPRRTAEAFVPDPFAAAVDGRPGTRLYRTGDLARWRPEGEVEFLGRIDDQLKIRGFRVEPGEVESVLASHPGLRSAAVARIAGEQRLTAFVVPSEEDGPDEAALRSFLAARLPDYMVPTAYVAVPRLPLSANGKVDRRELGRLVSEGRKEGDRTAPRDDVERGLVEVFRSVFARDAVGVHESFEDLGGDSLLALRLLGRVERRFGRRLPLDAVLRDGTVAKLGARLRASPAAEPGGDRRFDPLVPLQPEGEGAPFFCVHPAGGNVHCYRDLARRLGSGQPFYGLQARGREDGEEPIAAIPEMARLYVQAIRRVDPRGPYLLGGWSLGGLVAFEMARQITARGGSVALLAVLDAGPRLRLEERTESELLASLLAPDVLLDPREVEAQGGLDDRLAFVLRVAAREGLLPEGLDLPRARRLFSVYRTHHEALRKYEIEPWEGRVELLRAGGPGEVEDPTLGWAGVAAGGVEVHVVPGRHDSLVAEPSVGPLAAALERILERYRAALDSSAIPHN